MSAESDATAQDGVVKIDITARAGWMAEGRRGRRRNRPRQINW